MLKEHRVRKEIMISEALWDTLGGLGEELKIKGGKGNVHSQIVREMVQAAVTKWRESPYVCHSARHFIFVTGEGHIFYRLIQDLKLNSFRHKLPCVIEMKPEKRQDFLRSRMPSEEEANWLRSQWLLNHFSAWHRDGDDIEGQPQSSKVPQSSWTHLSSWIDIEGADYKMADLPVHQEAGRYITREIIVGLEKYVQWHDGEGGYDRVDLPIDIPTRNLEVVAIVDADLYRNTPVTSLKEIQELGAEFRNREGARFESKNFGVDSDNPMEPYANRHTGGKPSPRARKVLECFEDLKGRIQSIQSATREGQEIFSAENRARIKNALRNPENFLFYQLEWPSPYFGLEVCVHWQKAVRLGPK